MKEKHCKELEQIQAELIQEKTFLFALQDQTKAERKKEQKHKSKTEKDCRYDIQHKKLFDCQYPEPLDLQCHKNVGGTFSDLRGNSPSLGDSFPEKRFSSDLPTMRYQDMRDRKYQNSKTQQTPDKKPEPTRYNNVPDLQDYQNFFNMYQAPLQKLEDHQRRRSLDMTQSMKSSQNYMNTMEREEMMRNEMYKQHMSHGAGHMMTHDYPSMQPTLHKRHSVDGGHGLAKHGLADAVCEGCGKMANFMCSACKGVHYCTTQCQVGSLY